MNQLSEDESACHNPQPYLEICKACKRSILLDNSNSSHSFWDQFEPTKIGSTVDTPNSSAISCTGYLDK